MRISTKGRYGTMAMLDLALHSSQIRLNEIIRAAEGSMAPVECVDAPEVYPQAPLCAVYDVWVEMKTAINNILESTTLQGLLERQRQKWALKRLNNHT
jgi:DNA-binding IscR family transcriptional regulator